jgi:hypothetical protein
MTVTSLAVCLRSGPLTCYWLGPHLLHICLAWRRTVCFFARALVERSLDSASTHRPSLCRCPPLTRITSGWTRRPRIDLNLTCNFLPLCGARYHAQSVQNGVYGSRRGTGSVADVLSCRVELVYRCFDQAVLALSGAAQSRKMEEFLFSHGERNNFSCYSLAVFSLCGLAVAPSHSSLLDLRLLDYIPTR